MKKNFCIAIILAGLLIAGLDSCKKVEKIPEPVFVIKKWAKAIEELNYRKYAECEAYPKDVSVFKEMYRDYYIIDLMAIEADEADEEDIKRDYYSVKYIQRSVVFEGTAVRRDTKKPYQLIRGDAEFIKFLEGENSDRGWLLSNRTITRINK